MRAVAALAVCEFLLRSRRRPVAPGVVHEARRRCALRGPAPAVWQRLATGRVLDVASQRVQMLAARPIAPDAALTRDPRDTLGVDLDVVHVVGDAVVVPRV